MENRILYGVFSQVLQMSLTASIVICMVLGIRLCFRRAPRLFCYLLWSVVLFRLLCPVAAVSSFSVFGIWDAKEVQNKQTAPVPQAAPPIRATLPEKSADAVSGSADASVQGGIDRTAAFNKDTAGNAAGGLTSAAWLLGTACMAGYSFAKTVRLKRRLAGAACIKDNIYRSDYIGTPFVMGVFSPKIYLPGYLSAEEQKLVILHEQVHIKRGDPFIKLMAFAALALHWFNPFVWIAFYTAEKDMEMSCDETVIRQMKDDIRAEYCTALLNLTVGKTIFRGTPLAFGEGDTKNRVKNVMLYQKPAALAVCTASVLLVACLVGFGTNPGTKKTDGGAVSLPSDTETENITDNLAQDTKTDRPKETEPAKRVSENPDHTIETKEKYLGSFGSKRRWSDSDGNGEQVIYSATADITHDGILDRIDLMIDTKEPVSSAEEYIGGIGLAYIRAYEGKEGGGFAEEAFYVSGEVTDAHAGNGQIGLARKDGQEYLLISNIWEGQGHAGYDFTVFYLDPGQKQAAIVDEGAVGFETGDPSVRKEALERQEVVEFRERLKMWTQDADLFVSCDLCDSGSEICLSKPGKAYRACDYYDRIWERGDF